MYLVGYKLLLEATIARDKIDFETVKLDSDLKQYRL